MGWADPHGRQLPVRWRLQVFLLAVGGADPVAGRTGPVRGVIAAAVGAGVDGQRAVGRWRRGRLELPAASQTLRRAVGEAHVEAARSRTCDERAVAVIWRRVAAVGLDRRLAGRLLAGWSDRGARWPGLEPGCAAGGVGGCTSEKIVLRFDDGREGFT